MIRVLIADDQPLVRIGLRVLIESEDGFEVAGEAADGREAVDLTRRLRPDVVLMDIRMPVRDGLAALRDIAADPALSAVRVIMLTTFEMDEYIFEALRDGASGFLVKDGEPGEVLRAMSAAVNGGALMSPTVTGRVIREFAARPAPGPPPRRLAELTARELEVLGLVGEGLSNDEIAARLVVSPATVRTHVSRAMAKLGARDRAGLVVIAHRCGLAR
ncbi:response regulator transcription factor [Streptosporangium pseudovulgare]|uniref:DNA-binding response regulator n=1 Tax=Streptosporangium pseudovulgare TaxID=35765 RepID=A0ABQ2QYU3_9ACTN|nr:response regulator transcription factor [Streptosporangium pseudovulgare]GGQ00011.1 DNA-binding response regulator [Streptosporangium pseudovulgare]